MVLKSGWPVPAGYNGAAGTDQRVRPLLCPVGLMLTGLERWGMWMVGGLLVSKGSDPDFVSEGMCLLQRSIAPVLFDLAHLDCLNSFSSQISVRELLSQIASSVGE